MIGALLLLVIGLCVPTHQQSTPNSPCPNVFNYEPSGTEAGRWYGVVNLSTDSTLHSLWLNIVLDSKADILGNWVGDVTTTDNTDFKIENTKMKIHPGPAVAIRFFVQYNVQNKVPRLHAIRLNGREICNADHPQPAVDRVDTIRPQPNLDSTPDSRPTVSRPSESRPSQSRPNERPSESRPAQRPEKRPTESQTRPTIVIRPEDKPQSKPVYGRPSGDGPVYVPTANPPIDQSNVNPYSIGGGQVPAQSVSDRRTTTSSYQQFTPRPSYPTRPRDDEDDNERVDPDEYWSPGPATLPSAIGSGSGNKKQSAEQCGIVIRNNANPLVVNGKPTLEGQWPWQIALYQTQLIDSKYICGGTLVSHKHVITAAHCVTRKNSAKPVYKNTLTVYLGKHNLRTSVEGVEIRFVDEIIVYPEYNKTPFARDLSILKLKKWVDYTEYVRAACLWPEDQTALSNVIGKKGSVVGWGFDDTGVATEELSLVEMPVVDQETCIRSYSAFFDKFTDRDYTYCAGYRDGTSVCNGDSGGGMVFEMQGSWYLRGLVSLSVARHNEYRCDPTHYVVFTDLAKFLPWIRGYISSSD
ncbi:CLIP domain-containing serine protease B4 isoform X2 [Bicyclus anynana]|uniref:CLIP domain-containing serine protease B4 isoform X2 n=1 Tax=Bicyclus anynana TaxID=110368 RepID=A0ABM3LJE5_BICAN|nr:CLIP domain-containing serine protease B4 isoform X2 [Bicyclus anynana]